MEIVKGSDDATEELALFHSRMENARSRTGLHGESRKSEGTNPLSLRNWGFLLIVLPENARLGAKSYSRRSVVAAKSALTGLLHHLAHPLRGFVGDAFLLFVAASAFEIEQVVVELAVQLCDFRDERRAVVALRIAQCERLPRERPALGTQPPRFLEVRHRVG